MSFFLVLAALIGFFLFVGLLLVISRIFPKVSVFVVAWIFGASLVDYLSAILAEGGGWEFLGLFVIVGAVVLFFLSLVGVIFDFAFMKEGWGNVKRDLEKFVS